MNNFDVLSVQALDVEKPQRIVQRKQSLYKLVSNVRLVKYDENVVQILNLLYKKFKLVAVQNSIGHMCRKACPGLGGPLPG